MKDLSLGRKEEEAEVPRTGYVEVIPETWVLFHLELCDRHTFVVAEKPLNFTLGLGALCCRYTALTFKNLLEEKIELTNKNVPFPLKEIWSCF